MREGRASSEVDDGLSLRGSQLDSIDKDLTKSKKKKTTEKVKQKSPEKLKLNEKVKETP